MLLSDDEIDHEQIIDSVDDNGYFYKKEVRYEDVENVQYSTLKNVDFITSNDFSVFGEFEEIPLALQTQRSVVKQSNGQSPIWAKMVKCYGRNQYIPKPWVRARHIMRVLVSYIDFEARDCKSALEVWQLFFTNYMVEDIVIILILILIR